MSDTSCGLCLKLGEVSKSHLMPKALYKKVRNGFDGNNIALFQNHNKVGRYTDTQITADFLCPSCESLFSRIGENIVIPYCYSGEKSFPMLNWMSSATHFEVHKNELWVNPIKNNFAHLDAFLYFALSIFWRASAWPKSENSNQGSLGSTYQEQFRKYLLGEQDFPANTYLTVYVDTDADIQPIMSFPTSIKKKGYHLHSFHIPGIKFNMCVGKDGPGVKELSESLGTRLFLVSYSFSKHPDYNNFRHQLISKFSHKGKLRDELNAHLTDEKE
mgnify:CR=1 FL=1